MSNSASTPLDAAAAAVSAPIRWDVANGTLTFAGRAAIMMWQNPSLLHLLKPLVYEAGVPLARMLIASSSRVGSAADYQRIVYELGNGSFSQGFPLYSEAIAKAGWGRMRLLSFAPEQKEAVVRVQNDFELHMQKDESVKWGSPFLLGKLCGILASAFDTLCWAEEHLVEDEPYCVDFHIRQSPFTLESETERLREERVAEREQHVIAKLVQAQTQSLRFRDISLQSIMRLAPSILFALDRGGVFQLSEGRKLAAIGFAPGQLVGKSAFDVYQDYPIVIENLRAVLNGEARTWDAEVMGVHFETQCVPLRDESGDILGAIGIDTDISERVSAARILREKQAALEVELQEKQKTILQLSTPIIRIWDGILLLPMVGEFDHTRALHLMDTMLNALAVNQASELIIDITGMSVVDTAVANHLIQSVQAAKLLGVRCTLVGITASVAQTLVHLGINLAQISTHSNLEAGLKHALARMNYCITRSRPPAR